MQKYPSGYKYNAAFQNERVIFGFECDYYKYECDYYKYDLSTSCSLQLTKNENSSVQRFKLHWPYHRKKNSANLG